MLKGKRALITGANRGIGRAILETFAAHGANVIACSRTPGSIDELSKSLSEKYNVDITPIYFDVSKYDDVKSAFQKIIKISRELDVLVNNAGILDNSLIGMLKADTLKMIFETNVYGVIYMMQFASRLMMSEQKGSIINLSSIVGVNGSEGQVAYSGSKAAIIGITKSASKELASNNIRVNAIAPGFIDTDMIKTISPEKYQERFESIKMGRIGSPEDIAGSALFLASDYSKYVTGQIIGVDGGMLI